MSSYLYLIPDIPDYVPESAARNEALQLIIQSLPGITVHDQVTEGIQFIDQGENFESVSCPACGLILDMRWWQQAMDQAWDQETRRFTNLRASMPCCGASASLNNLHYTWPAGFARFRLEIIDPGNDLNASLVEATERILGCRLRRVWAHY